MPVWATASFSGPGIASEVYLLTGLRKDVGILTGLWLRMATTLGESCRWRVGPQLAMP